MLTSEHSVRYLARPDGIGDPARQLFLADAGLARDQRRALWFGGRIDRKRRVTGQFTSGGSGEFRGQYQLFGTLCSRDRNDCLTNHLSAPIC